MKRTTSHGFVIVEVALLLSGITTLVGFVRAAEPLVDRFCAVATAPAPNGGRPARMMSDVGRWVCVSAPSDEEAPENEYAQSARDAATHARP